jgi:hypothetical protein
VNRFASDTSVSVERSKAEIERLLARYGAAQFVAGWGDGAAHLGFRIANRTIRFTLPLPDRAADEFTMTPAGRRRRNVADQERAWEQACRSRWRALLLVIKAKLEAAACGISTIEDEFLAWTVLPGGRGETVGQVVAAQIAERIATGKVAPLLLGGGS